MIAQLHKYKGVDPGYSFRGTKDYVRTLTSQVRSPLIQPGSRARLRALEALLKDNIDDRQ